ncbi:MAG: hypothetical protein IJV27_05715 [Prevotella sp.]|nr:hypothetical protein [Prevotella sp.]
MKKIEENTLFESGTLLSSAVYDAVEDFHSGRPIEEDITVDEVEVSILDDWAVTGSSFEDNGPVDIYAPLMLVKGEDAPERLFMPSDISGFTPERGHEYKLLIRRFYLTNDPFYHDYEMIKLISDVQTKK